jgi:hypothetical protein
MARPKSYMIDESVFDSISSHQAAYFLGYLFADAHIDRGIDLRIRADDIELLNNLRAFLKSTHPIRFRSVRGRSYACFGLSSVRLAGTLRRWGIPKNKHNNLHLPDISPEYLSSFVLGFFDGDGSIHIDGRDCTVCFTGGHSILVELQRLFLSKLAFSTYLRPRYEVTNLNSWMLEKHGPIACQTLLRWMYSHYDNGLGRKKAKASFVCSLKPIRIQHDELVELWRLRSLGLTARQIAVKLGRSHHSVRGIICRQSGIEFMPK